MLTGEIRNKVDRLWTDLWAGGIANPLTAIEQLTYLMFIRSLDEKEREAERAEAAGGRPEPRRFPPTEEGQSMRWSRFKTMDPQRMFDIVGTKVFPFIKTLNGDNATAFARYMQDAVFLIPTPHVLHKIVAGLDELYEHDVRELDMQGDVYEYMLGKLATAGRNGQFRTPKHIRDLMVRLIAPTPGETICDPACGTAGFLVSAAEYVRANCGPSMTAEQRAHAAGEMFTGFDTDRTMLRLSAMNLMLHAITRPNIDYADSVSKRNDLSDAFDIVLANPPFTGTVDGDAIHDALKSVCDTKKTELLFVALSLRMLRKGGRCACIVPEGVLFGASKAHRALRRELVDNHRLQAVIAMPSGVFKPYAGVSTAILLFTKTGEGGTDRVWFYDMKSDGYSLDDKRTPIDAGDLPDIEARFRKLEAEALRRRTEQSFFVEKAEIAANDYDLSIRRYKEVVQGKADFEPPEVILDRLERMNADIAAKTERLRGLLRE
ncbi:class I SAM-dependent DNA methyltransferase [Paenibacillus sp.]|uniref:type I restriction-modification system subunit M n=1 Tax=Paenibacillus sp. TaxID=58172 RepID=UPI002D76376A|nr:class I SAM-dependent DNA methyltransferase [Paenibacillus sp.]HZG85599.1 class I SAM-dependent DNA methyltransferase [Paenibacillus sp.]